ncbi:MAG: DUF2975 domain-containing protein [Ruminococcaceae bacterium]|nr:DUF2975 domain-containing protein [Oscillospiraceae bacterium]
MCRSTTILIKCALVLLLCGAIALFALWLPSLHEYVCELIEKSDLPEFLSAFVYPISALITIPIITVVAIAFGFPAAIERDEIFSNGTAKRLKFISIMIYAACACGIIATALLFSVGDRVLAPLLLFAFFIGGVLALMLSVLSSYVKRAAILKEEVDHTL